MAGLDPGHDTGRQAGVPEDYSRAFPRVHRDELERVLAWRARFAAEGEREGNGAYRPLVTSGLALSGGGIRSAAFCLGALQAIEENLRDGERTGLRHFDYLSTVSGGGYIGTSLICGLNDGEGKFPFSTGPGDRSDNEAIGHIRNHSRYLMPNGLPDLIGSLAIIARGLTANLAMVLGVVLILAGFTGIFNPTTESYFKADFLGLEGWPYPPLVEALGNFAYTKIIFLAGLALLFVWAIARSFEPPTTDEFRGPFYKAAYVWVGLLAFSAFIELQPFAIVTLTGYDGPLAPIGHLAKLLGELSPYLTVISGAAAIAGRVLGNTVKTTRADQSYSGLVRLVAAKIAAILVMLALPALIWLVYLHLSAWTAADYGPRPEWLQALLRRGQELAPAWMQDRLIAVAFVAVGTLLAGVTWLLSPNANSLHRLYRDRLNRAFLFNPAKPDKPSATQVFQDLVPANAPVHLINCALNIQGSAEMNKRGRNADFFFFSAAWTGSHATGFVRTSHLQKALELPDIATAMAVSGAAASSNMGSNTIRGLAPTLALLNIRLGYWMKNPFTASPERAGKPSRARSLRSFLRLYLAEEMLGQLDECSSEIYLTDGGHIDNLGLYELLRRKCRLILVIDAEADPQLTFSSFVACQRYARIDLGVRIDLPWSAIRPPGVRGRGAGLSGSHVAVGTIEYDDAPPGVLLYVKASLTGDENDYITYYRSKYPSFPHETTGDQFFSEEQFEAYRALGFHCLHGAFTGKSPMAGAGPDAAGATPNLHSIFTDWAGQHR